MREPHNLEVRLSKPALVYTHPHAWSLQPAMVVPLIAEELPDDDAVMAGIVPPPAPRIHRMWSRPITRETHEHIPISASAVEARKHVHRSVLRRLIRRPPLDKTRSLLVMPTTMTAGDQLLISGWMPPRISTQPIIVTDKSQAPPSAASTARLMVERRHRRCHSEQPRSWREPSAALWTLEEE